MFGSTSSELVEKEKIINYLSMNCDEQKIIWEKKRKPTFFSWWHFSCLLQFSKELMASCCRRSASYWWIIVVGPHSWWLLHSLQMCCWCNHDPFYLQNIPFSNIGWWKHALINLLFDAVFLNFCDIIFEIDSIRIHVFLIKTFHFQKKTAKSPDRHHQNRMKFKFIWLSGSSNPQAWSSRSPNEMGHRLSWKKKWILTVLRTPGCQVVGDLVRKYFFDIR